MNTNTITGSLIGSLKSRPEIIAMLVVVGAFLHHIESSETKNIAVEERREAREDLVAKQRMKTCHDIQSRGIEALDRNSAALVMHASSDSNLTGSIDKLNFTVGNNTNGLLEVQSILSNLIAEIDLHAKYSQRNLLDPKQ
jgi:hypothetical protein